MGNKLFFTSTHCNYSLEKEKVTTLQSLYCNCEAIEAITEKNKVSKKKTSGERDRRDTSEKK